jgi:hypothetical protein
MNSGDQYQHNETGHLYTLIRTCSGWHLVRQIGNSELITATISPTSMRAELRNKFTLVNNTGEIHAVDIEQLHS